MIAQARDRLVQNAPPVLDEAAIECGDGQIGDPEKQKEVLWRKRFKTKYNQAEPIQREMSAKIKAGLADYLRQWHTWKDETKEEGIRAAAEEGDILAFDTYVKKIMREKPFRPHLSFERGRAIHAAEDDDLSSAGPRSIYASNSLPEQGPRLSLAPLMIKILRLSGDACDIHRTCQAFAAGRGI